MLHVYYCIVCVRVTLWARGAIAEPIVAQLLFLARLRVWFLYFKDIYNLFECYSTMTYVFSEDLTPLTKMTFFGYFYLFNLEIWSHEMYNK